MLNSLRINKKLFIIIFVGLVIRVFLNNIVESSDAKSFVIWANFLSQNSVGKLYETLPGNYLPYPPTYYYILKPLGFILTFFENSNWLSQLIVKLPVFASEVISTLLIYTMTKKWISEKGAIISAAFFFLNPAIIYNTSVWGQIDSIIIMSTLAFLFLVILKREFLPLVVYLISVTVKLQALAILPLVIFWSFTRIKIRRFLNYLGILILLGLVIFLPLIVTKGSLWTVRYFYSLPNQYPYTSVYAYNLWSPRGFIISDDDKFLNLVKYRYLGLLLYWLIAIMITLPLLKLKKIKPEIFLMIGLILFYSFYFFSTRIHSRYLIYTLGLVAPLFVKMPKTALILNLLVISNLILPGGALIPRELDEILNYKQIVILFVVFGLVLFIRLMIFYKALLKRAILY